MTVQGKSNRKSTDKVDQKPADYNFRDIEKRWQEYWKQENVFAASNNADKPKYYVLDMFPYPSGAGLHVGHPLGYIASDIMARYYRHKGYNVLHPMGYDSFGLPAEQYAVETGQHPAVTTAENIKRYRSQLDKIGFSFDWNREVRTSDPAYYKWTQWIFIKLFEHWYDPEQDKAAPVSELIRRFETQGSEGLETEGMASFTADAWKSYSAVQQEEVLQQYRLAFRSDTWVNWCPGLGTVLANEEVKDGLSERGGFPVERRQMKQWSLRITAYADRLLDGLDKIDWPEAIKEQQRNWIGKSTGASVVFRIKGLDITLEVFTTRPDTLFGVSYLAVAPEHPLLDTIVTDEHRMAVTKYLEAVKGKSERERMAEVKQVSGAFTGAYVVHPFSGEAIPVWVADYVLAGYGTGAVMAVPAHDSRDYAFARHFNLPVKVVIGDVDISGGAYEEKSGTVINSGFLDGLQVEEAIEKAILKLEEDRKGERRVNYRLRDAIFSRQRYWGEPIPVYYKDDLPHTLPLDELPLVLPEIDRYQPTETGDPPLARAGNWKYKGEYPYELSTMPGWAGSSWYYLRYMDPENQDELVSEKAVSYWKQVDLYIGGAEHATGHLLYVRFWTKFLHDLGIIPFDEPAQKLINQGMIQGRSNLVYRDNLNGHYISKGLTSGRSLTTLHVDVSLVKNDVLDVTAFTQWRNEFSNATFELEDGQYICGHVVEKMSKRWYNVVNPDDIIRDYGADTLRMYEMFLGPLEISKPWNTNGIEGVHRFLKKFWRLFAEGLSEETPTEEELRILHRTIHKVTQDLNRYSFNTVVSTFMIAVNELSEIKTDKRSVLLPLVVLISPFAPHFAEELWHRAGMGGSVTLAPFPVAEDKYLTTDTVSYPVSFNGKTRFSIDLDAGLEKDAIEKAVLNDERAARYLDGKNPRKVIVVPGRIVNIVL